MAVIYNDVFLKKRHYFFTFFFVGFATGFFTAFFGSAFLAGRGTFEATVFWVDTFLIGTTFFTCFSLVDVVSQTTRSTVVATKRIIKVKRGFSSTSQSQKNSAHPQSKRVAHHCQDIGVHQKLSSFFLNQYVVFMSMIDIE